MIVGTILRKTKVAMNYENYIPSLVQGKNVGLINWPQGVTFKRMSKQSAIGPLHTLRDALKCGTCKWKVLSTKEKAKLIKQYDEMVESGEITKKVPNERAKKSAPNAAPRKSGRLVKGGDCASESGEEDSEEEGPKAPPTKTCRLVKGRESHENESDGNSGDEGGGGGRSTKNSETRRKLLALVQKARQNAPSKPASRSTKRKAKDAADDEGRTAKRTKAAGREKAPKRKRKAAEAGDDSAEDARPPKKAKSSEKPSKPAAKKGASKPAATAKIAKTVKTATASTPTIPLPERPRPRPIVKPVAATLPVDNAPSAVPPSPPSESLPKGITPPADDTLPPAPRGIVRGKRGGPPGLRFPKVVAAE